MYVCIYVCMYVCMYKCVLCCDWRGDEFLFFSEKKTINSPIDNKVFRNRSKKLIEMFFYKLFGTFPNFFISQCILRRRTFYNILKNWAKHKRETPSDGLLWGGGLYDVGGTNVNLYSRQKNKYGYLIVSFKNNQL